MVALIVGRPERVDWLRQFAPYTKVNENRIDPEFRGWGWRKPPVEFRPTPFIPQPGPSGLWSSGMRCRCWPGCIGR